MEKLDENYLDLVREGLYKNQSKILTKSSAMKSKNINKLKHTIGGYERPKNKVQEGFETKEETFKAKAKMQKGLKKKKKQKAVTFTDNTNNFEPESSSSKDPHKKIKNRVPTPFKNVKLELKTKNLDKFLNLGESQDCGTEQVLTNLTKLSPSLNENDQMTFFLSSNQNQGSIKKVGKHSNNHQRKKRRLSISDSTEISIKRKKENLFAQKGVRLVFDDSFDSSELKNVAESCPSVSQKNIITSKKKKDKNKDKKWEEKADITTLNAPLENQTEPNLNMQLVFDDSFVASELENVAESGTNVSQKSTITSKKKKVNNKTKKWEEKAGISTLNAPLENDTGPNLNNTWENFVCSLTKKPNEKGKKTRKKQKKNIMNTDCTNKQNFDIMDINETNTISSKISDFKNGNESKKIKKVKGKNQNLKESKNKKTGENGLGDISSDDPEVEFNFKKQAIVSNNVEEELSDSYDNDTVRVKGLKFQRFCNLFPPTHNEQFLGQNNTLTIPKKYFKITKNDLESNWQTEELSSLKNKKGKPSSGQMKKNTLTAVSESLKTFEEIEDTQTSEELPFIETTQKNLGNINMEKKQKDKINILDIQILSPKSQHSMLGIQKTTTFTSSRSVVSQENFEESVSEKAEAIDYHSEKENQVGLLSQPIIVTLRNDNKIIALNLGEETYFHGLCSIKVLNGELEILGASINSNSGEKHIYSPRGTALLYARNKNTLYVDSLVELKDLVSEELLFEKDVELSLNQHYAIFLCSELKEPYIDFIEEYISQKIFPESNGQGPRVDFKLSGSWNRIQCSEKWEELLENIPENSEIVISGGKGVGKSTFIRYAVNFLLRRFEKIRVIDLDPGQSEFYVPGCISVVTVNEEIFGPNYTHLLEPDSLILSHINIGYDIKKYLKSVRYLLESKTMKVFPTLINLPGFTQGLGLDISAQSLKMVQPSMVVQINSKSYNKNYKIDLTADNVCRTLKENNTLNQDESTEEVELSYDFVKFDSLSESNEAWSLEARQAREINILSYFGQMMCENVRYLTSTDVDMYSISVSALSITNAEGKAISPLAVNANLVGLCSQLDQNSDIFTCYGYGFVRGVDLQTDTLVLITPAPIEVLEKVSHLVLTSVTTPPSLIMTVNGVKGHIPYVNLGDPVDFGQFTKRSYLPPRK